MFCVVWHEVTTTSTTRTPHATKVDPKCGTEAILFSCLRLMDAARTQSSSSQYSQTPLW